MSDRENIDVKRIGDISPIGRVLGSPFFIDNKGEDMSDITISRDEDKILGKKESTWFEMDPEKETIYFWKSNYSWDEIIQLAEYIKESRELSKEPEEAPF